MTRYADHMRCHGIDGDMLVSEGLERCLSEIAFTEDIHKNAITRKLGRELSRAEATGTSERSEQGARSSEVVSGDRKRQLWDMLALTSGIWGGRLQEDSMSNISKALGTDAQGLLFLSKIEIKRRLTNARVKQGGIDIVMHELQESGHSFYHVAARDFCKGKQTHQCGTY